MNHSNTRRLLGLLAGCVAACSHSNATGAASAPTPAPATATAPSILTAEDIQRVRGQPIEQLLMGRFPGVDVARTAGGGISVHIRGVGSFLSSNEPLYVIDDVPLQAGSQGVLRGINPYDIESIQVLKDPAETAMYGVRGANGVILIRTKRPGH